MGAFGGPGAAAFWPFAFGAPQVNEVTISPSVLVPGDSFTVRARAIAE
jgi:hypothetical protein